MYREICQLEYAETAQRVGIPLGTLQVRLHEARKQVRPWLSDGS